MIDPMEFRLDLEDGHRVEITHHQITTVAKTVPPIARWKSLAHLSREEVFESIARQQQKWNARSETNCEVD